MYPIQRTVPRFEITTEKPQGLAYLAENGFVVWKRIADEQQVSNAVSLFWDYMSSLGTGLQRGNPASWRNESWPEPHAYAILQWYGVAQSPMMWFLRTLPKLRAVFEAVWNTTQLIVSTDGCAAVRGAEHHVEFLRDWLHIDHSFGKHPSYQGGLVLVNQPNHHDSGGFVCMPRSHEFLYDRFKQGFDRHRQDQYFHLAADHPIKQAAQLQYTVMETLLPSLQKNDRVLDQICQYLQPHQVIVPTAEPGDYILWHSGTVHQGYLPSTNHITDKLRRLVAYITMFPFSSIPTEQREEWRGARLQSAEKGVTTGHRADEMPRAKRAYAPLKHPLRGCDIYDAPEMCCKTQWVSTEIRLLLGL